MRDAFNAITDSSFVIKDSEHLHVSDRNRCVSFCLREVADYSGGKIELQSRPPPANLPPAAARPSAAACHPHVAGRPPAWAGWHHEGLWFDIVDRILQDPPVCFEQSHIS